MTGARVKVAFAAGAAIAGMLVAAARLGGVSEQATAIADEPVRPATVGPPPAGAPVPPAAAKRWRAKPVDPDEVTAQVVNRAATPKEPAPGAAAAAPPACTPAAPVPGREGTAGAVTEGAPPCPEKPREEPVEIDWNAPASSR